ncbi:MAG: hypothetical protein FJ123_09785 [Deltaproteobacteria bacterium]|nr:hypothetical protein [Deltaproteobacteria bacterium]
MFSKQSRREIPGVFRVVSITKNRFPGTIGSALLEMVSLCDEVVVMASPAGLFGAVRDFTLQGKGSTIKAPQDDLLVRWRL